MSKQTESSLFMFSPLAIKYAELYQQLLTGIDNYHQLGNRLIHLGERAHAFRQFDKVREVGQVLSSIPIAHYHAIGHYFLALGSNNKGEGDQDQARRLFELAVDKAPDIYKFKAILSLAAVSFNKGDIDSALYFCRETAKTGLNVSSIQAIRGISRLKAMEGDHNSAIKDLENLYPLIEHVPPHIYFDYLNSLAVELGEVGRREEARNICKVVLASPFAAAYPEWQETGRDLGITDCNEPRSRIVIRADLKQTSVFSIERTKPVATPENETKTASVLSFPKLKQAPPPNKPESVTPQELDDMDASEKKGLILAALRSNAIRESEYNKLIFMMGLLKGGPAATILDLEDEAVLDDLIVKWAALVEPEQLAAVLSALRDCEDDIRRSNIIDRMIRKAFEESRTCGLTEEEWRLRVERRLPEK